MLNRAWMLIAATTLFAACDAGEPDDAGPGQCAGGKCDSVAAPALEAITFDDAARCWSQLDTSTDDPFFQLDQLHCELPGLDRAGVRVVEAYANVRTVDHDDHSKRLVAGPDAVVVARLSTDKYPLTVRFTFMIQATTSESGYIDRLSAQKSSWRWGVERTFASRAELGAISAETPMVMGLPFEAWPVVLWPGADLQAAWNDTATLGIKADYGFDVAPSGALAVGGGEALVSAKVRRDRLVFGRNHSLATVGRTPMYLYAPPGDFAVNLSVAGPDTELGQQRVDGPGYYVVDAEYNLTYAEPADLPELADDVAPEADGGAGESDAGVVDAAAPFDAGPTLPIDASAPDAGAPDAAPEQCPTECTADEVCVAGACVLRANQRQVNCNSQAWAPCDAGQDSDCADGNVCVAGVCAAVECQTQHASCNSAAFRACETDDHCAEGHACALGLCVRLTCQTQHASCNSSAFRECEADTHCDEGHACVEGKCARLACQTQHASCNSPAFRTCETDDHCDEGHACADGKCARLTCQTQHASCNSAATRVCDVGEDSDCAEAHVCNDDARCERVSCQ